MPYKKTYRKKGAYKKRTYKKRTYKKVPRPHIETKEIQFEYDAVGKNADNFSSISYGSSSIASSLCGGIPAGTLDGTRIGRRIFVKAIRVMFAIEPGDDSNYIRFMLVQPKGRPNDTSLSTLIPFILSGYGSSSTQWFSPIDTDNWKVYMDKTMYLKFEALDGSSSASVPQAKILRKTIRINQSITYTTNTGTADQPGRDLWLVALSNSAAVAHPGVVAGSVKIWYTDA